ncbi:uncharacterized protein LOC124553979 [Schistocerca americana]|uniref:uncharacterized protein LOC124553979 n=1 Tax=Schistocerca americana TaxID=7009 RepID=UPI001F4F72AE|nr:uncharacterized protein LOC124553979 [Schistocerca americana]
MKLSSIKFEDVQFCDKIGLQWKKELLQLQKAKQDAVKVILLYGRKPRKNIKGMGQWNHHNIHNGPTYKCRKLRMLGIQQFHKNFYSSPNKIELDTFMLKYLRAEKSERDTLKRR